MTYFDYLTVDLVFNFAHFIKGEKIKIMNSGGGRSPLWPPHGSATVPPPLIDGGIKRRCCLTSVCLTSVEYIGPKSRTERRRKTKIGTEVAHIYT